MPVIQQSSFPMPAWLVRGAHVQTTTPTLLRKVRDVDYARQRIHTADGDFIDLDWAYATGPERKADAAAVLCHGLEGSSDRAYMRGMARAFLNRGVDAAAYNYRGCSGEPNLMERFYTAGATGDLSDVIQHIIALGQYRVLYLVGFSLGANLVLKYAGEQGPDLPPVIKGVVGISAPCQLRSSSVEMMKPSNALYHRRFLHMLRRKVEAKAASHPSLRRIDLAGIRTLTGFDDLVTAPLHGYKGAEDYWNSASCINELDRITVPALILNAADDPILGDACYPYHLAAASDCVYLEVPQAGGHVGFMRRPGDQEYWHETRTVSFLLSGGKNETEVQQGAH